MSKNYFKILRRSLHKKQVSRILTCLIDSLKNLKRVGDHFVPFTELQLINKYKKELKKYYPKKLIDKNWYHLKTLGEMFNNLNVWEAW